MDYDFNKTINRRGTDSLKFDGAASRGKPADVLPFWIADMDFAAPDCVLNALHERVAHGVFGYSEPGADYFKALAGWFTNRLKYSFTQEMVTLTPGVVYAIAAAIKAFTQKGDAVLIQEPVYYPFRQLILQNDRQLAVNELKLDAGTYTIDFLDFEQQIAEKEVKLFILCSPHNPVGRVWQVDELKEIIRICKKYDVLILSDEIHCDFVFEGHTHNVLPALFPEYQERIILCTAPSKTFNLAGLQLANVFIYDQALRSAYRREMARGGYSQANGLGIVACQAAYEGGAAWLEALNKHLWGNMIFVDSFLKENLPDVKLISPQATYLAWLDCRSMGLTPSQLDDKLVNKAGVWLSRGDTFGASGSGFVRVNVACTRDALEVCMGRVLQFC